MRRKRKNNKRSFEPRIPINEQIRAKELRIITDDGENLGVMSFEDALQKARDEEKDLIEISSKANPPIARIMEFGKWQYDEKKKKKAAKAGAANAEVKNIQVKVGTGDNDLKLKAEKASEWLKEGHKIKVELFLPGRTKYMDKEFLEDRLHRMLKLITENYAISQEVKKVPKGLMLVIERSKKKKEA